MKEIKDKEKKSYEPFTWIDLEALTIKLSNVQKKWKNDRLEAIHYFNNDVVLYDDTDFAEEYIAKVLRNRFTWLKVLQSQYKSVKGKSGIDFYPYFTPNTKAFLRDIGR